MVQPLLVFMMPEGVLEMSQLNNFLYKLQASQPIQYYAFGNGTYKAGYLRREYCEWSVVLLFFIADSCLS